MDKSKPPSGRESPKPSPRDQRLAKALRDNLRRRKAPAANNGGSQTPPSDDPASGEAD